MADSTCESTESIMSILDQMAESVQMDYSASASEQEPSSSSSSLQVSNGSQNADDKDDKYWERRRKNNLAAKKSRDARKIRENQLQCKVACLENANQILRTKLEREMRKNQQISEQMAKVLAENEELKKNLNAE